MARPSVGGVSLASGTSAQDAALVNSIAKRLVSG